MWTDSDIPTDLISFTTEMLNGKLHVLDSVNKITELKIDNTMEFSS